MFLFIMKTHSSFISSRCLSRKGINGRRSGVIFNFFSDYFLCWPKVDHKIGQPVENFLVTRRDLDQWGASWALIGRE